MKRRRAFTLIELTIVMLIIGILVGLSMSVFYAALAQSKAHRTRAIVAKIDQFINEKYESYRTRAVPIRIAPNTPPNQAAWIRVCALRDLMRMEMPDHREDVIDGPATLPGGYMLATPSLTKSYYRRAQASWTANPNDWSNDSAECLYLILASMRDGEKSALDFFSPTEIGDLDGNGLNEIHDSWGQPIVFFRWAPGYVSGAGNSVVSSQALTEPDPFDPLKTDPRWPNAAAVIKPFALKPLIVSTGPDKKLDLYLQFDFHYSQTSLSPIFSVCNSDPYVVPGNNLPYFGSPYDGENDGYPDYTDNITNHDLEAR